MALSKSKYLTGLRCRRLLWLDEHEPSAAGPDAATEHRMREGMAVDERARATMGAGVLVASPDFAPERKIDETQRAIGSGARLVFEATFSAGGGIVSADILRRAADGWDLIEVKSSNRVKDEQLPDVAMQLFVLRAAGLDVPRAYVMHLNPECRYPDLSDLFITEDVTALIEPLLAAVPGEIAAQRAMLAQLLLEPDRIGGDAEMRALRRDLLAYCHRDTEAMVLLAEALHALA